MAKESKRLVSSLSGEIYVLPNKIPWNKLLLDGKLAMAYSENISAAGVKTRNYPWPGRLAQPFSDYVLLYNSSRTEPEVLEKHQITERQPEKALVGLGFLILVKLLTGLERAEWTLRANNAAVTRKNMNWMESGLLPGGGHPVASAGAYGLFFTDLWKFEKPVEFKWPAGPVKSLRIKTSDIRGQLLKASIVSCK